MELSATISELLKLQVGKAKTASDVSRASFGTASIVLTAFVGLALVVGLGLAWVVTNGIVGPIQGAVRFADTVAKGDFTQRVAASLQAVNVVRV